MGLKVKDIQPVSTARPDERGRITLGSALTKDVSRFDVFFNEETGEVTLKPFKEIPANEIWFHKNEKAQNLVMKGLEEAKSGKVKKIDLKKSNWIDDIKDE